MKPTLDEQDITVYASDAQTIQEPFGSDYSQGVAVGKTIPAKWWNWLFRAATTRLHQAFSDLTNIFAELTNLLLDAQITPSASDNTQIVQAVAAKTNAQIPNYVQEQKQRFCGYWKGKTVLDANTNTVAYLSEIDKVLENGVFIGTLFTPGSSQTREKGYSVDGIKWYMESYQPVTYNYLASCFLKNKYYGFTCSEQVGDTLSVHIRQTDGVWQDSTIGYSDDIYSEYNIPKLGAYYTPFFAIIENDLFYMAPFGRLYKYSSATNSVTDTGVTAQALNLRAGNTSSYGYRAETEKIIPVKVGSLYFVGNLMYDGTNWSNVCPTLDGVNALDASDMKVKVLRSGKIAFESVMSNFTVVDLAKRFGTYDISTGVSTLSDKYVSVASLHTDDVVICYKDYASEDYGSLVYTYDGTNFIDIPLANVASVAQIKDGFLLNGRTGGDASTPYIAFCRGELSSNVDDYVVHSTSYYMAGWQYLARISKDSNICVSVYTPGSHWANYAVYALGANVAVVQVDAKWRSGAVAYSTLMPLRLADFRDALCFKMGESEFTAYFSASNYDGTSFASTDMFTNEVIGNTLYLH